MTKYEPIYDAAIIGAGPAGMMAAIKAGERGRKVILLEKNGSPGRKLLIAGKGRCNITNSEENIDEFLRHFSASGSFLRNCFHRFFNNDLIEFFRSGGSDLKIERGGRVFPKSDDSGEILKALLNNLRSNNITLRYFSDINDISHSNGLFRLSAKNNFSCISESLLVATGGLSYPATGSTGFGYTAARQFGHTIIDPAPALVGLEAAGFPRQWQGITLENVSCIVFSDGESAGRRFGDMLFTHFGLSGPIILDLSAVCYDELRRNHEVVISIDLKPALREDKLEARLIREIKNNINKNIETLMKNLLPARMAEGALSFAGVDCKKKSNQVTKEERSSIVKTLKSLNIKIKAARPIAEAIVTRGGVSTKEINPKTMESKLVKDLYFAGEVIDVDAKTGGYNLQAAFSTGYSAGENI